MTLSRQLIVLILLLLLSVFAGTFLIGVHNARAYLEEQLGAHAQDTATSLGLSVSPHMAQGDTATVTSMADAIFDSGYYRVVRIEDMKGNPLVDHQLPVKIDGVPSWFVNSLPLDTPLGEAAVMAGWRQAGKVLIRSHPGYAYRQLWENLYETFWWFLLSAVAVVGVGLILLRWVMKPLKQVEWLAASICNREFPVLDLLPRTLDLRRIVEAMNRLSKKVQRMLTEKEELVTRLRGQAYQHPVTELANRRYFLDTLEHRLASPEVCSRGVLCLIQLVDLKAYNIEFGYAAGDELLRRAAEGLQKAAAGIAQHTLAHLSGGDFALLAEECSAPEGEALARHLVGALNGVMAGKTDTSRVGIAYFDGPREASKLMAEADMALRAARSQGGEWQLYSGEEGERESVHGAMDWRDIIRNALDREQILLHLQPVYSCPSKVLHHREALVRIRGDGEELLEAGAFMPTAESLGLAPEIDRAVVLKALQWLAGAENGEERLAVNLSLSSLQAPGFLDWLEQTLESRQEAARRIVFELPEYGAVAGLERVRDLIGCAGRHGAWVALDHFGRGFSSLAYLRSLKIQYLKIDGSFLRNIDANPDHQFYIQALAEIAHGLDISVVAESVESQSVWDTLPRLNVDGAQGYFLGRPV